MNFMEEIFSGQRLYGDNLTVSEIEKWFLEEEEAYSSLGSADVDAYKYRYHAMNKIYGFDYIPRDVCFSNALGVGSAYGQEFLPLVNGRVDKISILEPSAKLRSDFIGNLKPEYTKPVTSGKFPFEDNEFNLILCLGTLHHIPNVSFVLAEMIRVLKKDGYMLIREPISTMGDWRKPRKGLTRNERGIPHTFFDRSFASMDIRVIKKSFCDSLFLYKIFGKILPSRDSVSYYKIDKVVSKLLSWNIHYHRTNIFQKIAPGSIYYVLKK